MGRSHRALRLAAVLTLLAPVAQAAPGPRPVRVMSISLCTDLLLPQMVPKSRIASITYLAREAGRTLPPGATDGIRLNTGTAEDMLKDRPDLILAGDLSTPMTRRLARAIGAPIVEVASAQDFAGVRRAIRQVGDAVGERARAQTLISEMDAKLATLRAQKPVRLRRVVAWSGGLSVPGRNTLANAIIEAAGAVNVAAGQGAGDSTFDVEELLAADPDALLYGKGSFDRPSARGDQGQHRVVRAFYGTRRIAYDEVAYSCGLPQSIDAAVDLRRRLDALPPRARRLK